MSLYAAPPFSLTRSAVKTNGCSSAASGVAAATPVDQYKLGAKSTTNTSRKRAYLVGRGYDGERRNKIKVDDECDDGNKEYKQINNILLV